MQRNSAALSASTKGSISITGSDRLASVGWQYPRRFSSRDYFVAPFTLLPRILVVPDEAEKNNHTYRLKGKQTVCAADEMRLSGFSEILYAVNWSYMDYPVTNSVEKKKLGDWIAFGFKSCAAKCADENALNNTAQSERIAAKMRQYSDEFARVLRRNADENGLDLPQLRKDLLRLIDKRCPANDVVELIIDCVSDFDTALSAGLHYLEATQKDLSELECCYRQAADAVSELRTSLRVGPLTLIPGIPTPSQRAFHRFAIVSERASIAKRLLRYRPFTIFQWFNAFLHNADLVFLYLLLRRFRLGYPTLSRLLRTMRHVRHKIDGDGVFLRMLDCKFTKTGGHEGRDPLSELALQRRLCRFCDLDRGAAESFRKCVRFHYADPWAKRRERGQSLMESVDEIWTRFLRVQRFREATLSRSAMSPPVRPKEKENRIPPEAASQTSSGTNAKTSTALSPNSRAVVPRSLALAQSSMLPETAPTPEFAICITDLDDVGPSSAERKPASRGQ